MNILNYIGEGLLLILRCTIGLCYALVAIPYILAYGTAIAIVVSPIVVIVHIVFETIRKNYIYYLSRISTKKFIKYVKKLGIDMYQSQVNKRVSKNVCQED